MLADAPPEPDQQWLNPPGLNEAGRQAIRDGRPIFEAQMLALGAIALDGTAPTASVADELLAHITQTGFLGA